MSRIVSPRRAFAAGLALTVAGTLAAVSAPAVAAADPIVRAGETLQVTLGPGAGIISHPNLTVEVGGTLVYSKSTTGTPFHIIEHLEIVPGLTYQQNRTRCQQAYTNFEIECHWMDIILTVPPATDTIGVPGNPPAGNGLFYGTTITASPHTFRWDTGVWHDQHVVGYLGKAPITQPRTFTLIDALNAQQIVHNVTIVPRGWFVAPTLSLPASMTVNATSPDGAVVTYAASATGYGGAAVPVDCVPASGSTFAIGTTTVTCTASGNGDAVSTGTFDVHVKGADEQLSDLVAAGTGVGPGHSLANKAMEIQAKLAAGDVQGACRDLLRSYPNAVMAQSGKRLAPETADALLEDAARIAAVIGCSDES